MSIFEEYGAFNKSTRFHGVSHYKHRKQLNSKLKNVFIKIHNRS